MLLLVALGASIFALGRYARSDEADLEHQVAQARAAAADAQAAMDQADREVLRQRVRTGHPATR